MQREILPVSLETLQDGRAIHMFNEELRKVMQNVEDECTSPKFKRSITLTVTFKPDSERKFGTTVLSIKSKLAPITPNEKKVYFDYNDEGVYMAFEDNPEDLDADYKEANAC